MVILFITYPPNIRELNKNIPFIWIYRKHTCKISQCLCYLKSWTPTLSYFRSSYSGAPPKIRTFLDLPYPHFLFKPFDFKSNEFEFKTFKNAHSIFSWNMRIFASPGNLFPCPNSFSTFFFLFFPFLPFFLLFF